jgi:hypothetical protein
MRLAGMTLGERSSMRFGIWFPFQSPQEITVSHVVHLSVRALSCHRCLLFSSSLDACRSNKLYERSESSHGINNDLVGNSRFFSCFWQRLGSHNHRFLDLY